MSTLPVYTLNDLGIRPVPTLKLRSKKANTNGAHAQKAKEYFANFMETTEKECNEMNTEK